MKSNIPSHNNAIFASFGENRWEKNFQFYICEIKVLLQIVIELPKGKILTVNSANQALQLCIFLYHSIYKTTSLEFLRTEKLKKISADSTETLK